MNRLVVQLIRLEKARHLNSHTNRKLIDAAHGVAEILAGKIGSQAAMAGCKVNLPRGYRIVTAPHLRPPYVMLTLVTIDWHGELPRQTWKRIRNDLPWRIALPIAKQFADDIASGWLNEVVEQYSLQWEG